MGKKGDKLTKDSNDAVEALLIKLATIDGLTSKKMFGGHGLFHNSKMFGLIDSKGQSYLKVNESNKPDYEAKQSIQHSRMPYYSIPEDVKNDIDLLSLWVNKSIKVSK